MDINTRDIGYFLAVAHAGNLAGASRACHVTEAALSKAIGRVEIAVGFPVFERSKKGMVLTQAGKVIHTHAVRIRHEHDDTMSLAADMRSGVVGFLRVGATRPVYDGFVAPAIAQLIREQPGLELRVVLDIAGSLTTMLELGQLDLVFAPIIGTPARNLEVTQFGHDELTVVARTGHPFFRKRSKTMADLLQYSWIIPPRHTSATSWLEERFAAAGLAPPKVVLEVDYAGSATIDLAAATDLLLLSPGAGPSRGGQKCVRRIDIPELEFKRPVYAIARRGCYWSLSMKALVNALSQK